MLRVCQTPISIGGDAPAQLPDHFLNLHQIGQSVRGRADSTGDRRAYEASLSAVPRPNLPIYHSTTPKPKRRAFADSPLMIPGRAPLVELRPPACRTSQLRPGCPVAPTGNRLWLLPSGPDQVHRSAPHRTQPSTLLSPAVPAAVEPSEWEFSPAIADCEYRAPLAPRLARPGGIVHQVGVRGKLQRQTLRLGFGSSSRPVA